MRKNKGLNPAHHEVKTIFGDMLEPMYNALLPLFDEVTNLRKAELDVWFRRARTTDQAEQNAIALELKNTVARIQEIEAEMERKRTCIRAFLMLASQKVNHVRRETGDLDFKPELTWHQEKLLGALVELEPQRYELA